MTLRNKYIIILIRNKGFTKKNMAHTKDIENTENARVIPAGNSLANPSPATRDEIASDLQINREEVEVYFNYYEINNRFPIRTLTSKETDFARAIYNIKVMSKLEILDHLARYNILEEDFHNDPLCLARAIAGLKIDDDYYLMIKWYPYLLEPFVMYGNSTAPLLRPLTKPELFIIISNIAIGNSMIPGQKVEIKDQMNAVQKLIDAYSLVPQTQEHLNEEDLYQNLSVKELKNMARLLESAELQQKLAADKKKSKTKATKTKTTKTKTTKKKITKKKEE